MVPVVASIISSIVTFFSGSVVRVTLFKIALTAVLFFVLPVILRNFFFYVLSYITGYISSTFIDINTSPIYIQLSSLGSYFAIHLKLIECLDLILSAVMIRFTLKLIPFVRL